MDTLLLSLQRFGARTPTFARSPDRARFGDLRRRLILSLRGRSLRASGALAARPAVAAPFEPRHSCLIAAESSVLRAEEAMIVASASAVDGNLFGGGRIAPVKEQA